MPSSREPSTTAAGALLLLEPVGEVEQRRPRRRRSTRPHDHVDAADRLVAARLDVDLAAAAAFGFASLRACSSSARSSSASRARAVQERVRLAGR